MTHSTRSGQARGVLILTPYFYPIIGGVESNAERLARYLVAQGVRVQVLTKRIGRDLADQDDRDGIAIRRVGPSGERSSLGKWLMTPAIVRWLIRHSADYDVVCCVDYRATGVAALLARRSTGRPVVFQAQTTGVLSGDNVDPLLRRVGIGGKGLVARAVKSPVRALYRGADAFACISRDIERETLACGVARDECKLIERRLPCGVLAADLGGDAARVGFDEHLKLVQSICRVLDRGQRWRLDADHR